MMLIKLFQITKNSHYSMKEIYYLAPSGNIGHLYVERGILGADWNNIMTEKKQAKQWLKQLNEWKKQNIK